MCAAPDRITFRHDVSLARIGVQGVEEEMVDPLQQALHEAADPTLLMRRVAEQAMQLIPNADGASLEVRVDENTLEYLVAVGSLEPYVGLQLAIDTSLSGLAVLTGKITRTGDAPNDPRADTAAILRTGVISLLALPLAAGEGIAVPKVTSQQPDAFTPADDRILVSLADFVSTALRLSSELARVTAELLADGGSDDHDEQSLQAARFVAEVLRPGLVEDIRGHRHVREFLGTTKMDVVLQPIADLQTGRIEFVEALSRFVATPHRSPDQWFAQAHRVGLGAELELAAVQNAVAMMDHLPGHVSLCINIGPSGLRSGTLLELIPQRHRRRVILEITEHESLEPLVLDGPLEEMRDAGIRIAVDDAGSGYAGLSMLLRIEPEVVKLDRELVRGIDHDPVRRALARALVLFAEEDGVATIVAEGIETEAEAAALVALGVRFGQGYFLARPSPPGQIRWEPTWHMSRPLPLL
jgi:EAL domain-containing protein (putative c-di-GMP-specific phosphodiesterase class I)